MPEPSPAAVEARPAASRGHRGLVYLSSVVFVGATALVLQALVPVAGSLPTTLFFVLAVVASAWAGGLGPGLVATAASLGAAHWIALGGDPGGAAPAGHAVRLLVLAVVGVAVSLVSETRQRALRRAEGAAAAAARGERELRHSEERFRRIVDTAHEGIWELDAEARVVYCNRRMAEMLGLPPDEIRGRRALEFLSEEQRPRAEAAWRERAAGQAGIEEVAFSTHGGRELQLRAAATPVFDEGSFVGAFALFTDVTEARRSAEATRASESRKTTQLAVTQVLAESSGEEAMGRILATTGQGLGWDCGALWLVDGEANVLRCVEFWRRDGVPVSEFEDLARQAAFSPGVGLPGRVWTSGEGAWITELSRDANFPRLAEATAAGLTSAFAFPVTLGREVLGVIEFFSRQRREPDPELLSGFAGVGSQVGQFLRRTRAEAERAQLLEREQSARQEAEAAARAKDEFLAVLSHELRTPLNAIVGWSHLLRTGQLDAGQATRAVEVIDRNAKAQAQIVADVLDVSRIVMGKVRLDFRPVDLVTVVDMALDTLRPAAAAKEIRLDTAITPEGAQVMGDVDRLQQVVWNLLSNAVKFTPGRGRVLVQLRRAGGHAELRIEDTGMGIEPELLPHVFERFRQGDSSSTRAHGGLGLGLALVRHLVEMHGGTVQASSAGKDRGAAFVVTLPLAAGGAAERADEPKEAPASEADLGTGPEITPAVPPPADRPAES